MAVFQTFWRYRRLIWELSKRDVIGRYRGSMLGIVWAIVHPLMMLAVYSFVFILVFKARWGTAIDNELGFAVILFAGLIVHALFAENLNRAPHLVTGNVNYVKRVVFPIEILPWVSVVSSLFHACLSFGVLLTWLAVADLPIRMTALLLPLVLLPLLLVAAGLGWLVSAIGVYFRDIGQLTGITVTVLLFLSPIMYPLSVLPETYQRLLYLNPLTFIVEETRAVLLFGKFPAPGHWAAYLVCSVLIAWIGLLGFQKARKGFADVL